MNRTDAHHLFTSQPKYREEAHESWWANLPREGATEIAQGKRTRMSNSREGRGVSSTFIVGHAGRSK